MAKTEKIREGRIERSKKQSVTLGEKMEILEFISQNPQQSLAHIAKVFSDRFQKTINRMLVCRIKKDADNIRNTPESYKQNVWAPPKNILEFQQDYYHQITQHIAVHGSIVFDQARTHGINLQKTPKYEHSDDVQKMRFSRSWWTRYQKNRGLKLHNSNPQPEIVQQKLLGNFTPF